MQPKIHFTCKATSLIVLSVILSNKITSGDDVEAINSFGIKSEVGKCNFKNGPNDSTQGFKMSTKPWFQMKVCQNVPDKVLFYK